MFYFLLILIPSLFALEPLERRVAPAHYKVSIIIPCHHRHFEFLDNLLLAYQAQLNPSDEVVISLSGVEEIPPYALKIFEKRSWPFHLKLVKTIGRKNAAENRNTACSHSTGDVLICQDADDLPHRRRVPILRYLFEHFEIDFLLHQYEFQSFTQEQQLIRLNQAVEVCHLFKNWVDHEFAFYVPHGCPALMRYVWETIQWEERPNCLEDTWFNNRVFARFPHMAILCVPLIAYRPQYSIQTN